MGFLAIVNAYTMRICLNVAITEMTVKYYDNGTEADGVCPYPEGGEGEEGGGGDYEWSESLQGLILSAFFYGYVITHLPGGMLAERFGGKWCLSLGILSTAIFTLLTPIVVKSGGPIALIVLRFVEGLGEGTTFPALSALLAAWIPLTERSKMGALVFGGGQVGTILGTFISGQLLDRYAWDSVFYFFGAFAVLWFIVFTLICYSDPESHPFIKDSEKVFLKQELGRLERDKNLPPTPWLAIITNAPMLALICAQIGHDWGFFIMVTDLPKYMSDVLHFSIKSNGLWSSLPYLVMWIVSITTGFLGDWLIKKRYISITNSRKLFTTIASVFPSIFIMLASYAGCSKTMVVVYFTLAMGFMGTFYPGMKVNPLDLSPNYAGTLMALTNGIGAITGIVAPTLVGVMTPNVSIFSFIIYKLVHKFKSFIIFQRTLYEWRTVFWIAFGIFNVTNLVYVIWASGETQAFDNPKKLMQAEDPSDDKIEEEKTEKKMVT